MLYKTLEPMLYNVEPDMVKPLIECLVVLINKKLSVEDKLKVRLGSVLFMFILCLFNIYCKKYIYNKCTVCKINIVYIVMLGCHSTLTIYCSLLV